MKIGFDISQTGSLKAGCGFFTDSLIRQLALIDQTNQYQLYPTFGNHFWDDYFQNTLKIAQNNFSQGIFHNSLSEAVTFWKNSTELVEKKLGNIDLLHSNNFFCPTQLKNIKLIYTLFDLSFFEYPDCTTEHNRLACFKGIFNASLYADFIICISNYTRDHFLKYFPYYPKDRIAVTPLANRLNQSEPFTISSKIVQFKPQQFWLNVGTLEPRKNIKGLLKAYAKLIATQKEPYPLVLAGKIGWLEEDIEAFIETLDIQQHVHILGYVENAELQWLYQNCFCFIFPSFFEGFGLPVLEAMYHEAPVISSNVSSLSEIVADAAFLIDPHKEETIFQAMQYIFNHPQERERMKALGKMQAERFSWENTAKKVLSIYSEVLQLPKYAIAETI